MGPYYRAKLNFENKHYTWPTQVTSSPPSRQSTYFITLFYLVWYFFETLSITPLPSQSISSFEECTFLDEEGQYEDNNFYPLWLQWASDCGDFDRSPRNNKSLACGSLVFKHNLQAVKSDVEGVCSLNFTHCKKWDPNTGKPAAHQQGWPGLHPPLAQPHLTFPHSNSFLLRRGLFMKSALQKHDFFQDCEAPAITTQVTICAGTT